MKKFAVPYLFFALVASLPSAAQAAGDAGLYDAPPPPNSAFIRILNAGPGSFDFDMTIAGKTLPVAAQSLGSYVIVSAGAVDLAGRGTSKQVKLDPGKFYTFAVSDSSGNSQLYVDDGLTDPAKGRLYFYNLTAENSVELYVPAAKTDALSDLPASSTKSVEIRAPLEVDMVAKAADSELATFESVKLKRRSGTSLVLSGKAGSYSGFTVSNTIAQE
jgi:alginate O-acetyltransferase complex protein AlgF